MSKKKREPKQEVVPDWTQPPALKEVSALVYEAQNLPVFAFDAIKAWTVGDIVKWAQKLGLKVEPRRRRKQSAKGQTEATEELDEKVLSLVRSVGRKRKDKKVVMKDLVPRLDDYSDQQIRRALVRLTTKKSIKAHGATKDKTYEVA